MKRIKLMSAALLGGAALQMAAPVQAAVMTTGCGGDGCTLSELAGGGTITVEDVLFDSWSTENVAASFGGLDSGTIDVTGSSDGSSVTLDFAFASGLSIDAGEFIEFLIDFDASLTSSRTITGASIALGSAVVSGPDNFAFVQTGLDIGGSIAEAFLSSEDVRVSDGFDLGSLAALSAAVDIQGEAEDDMSVLLSRFSVAFRLDGELPPDGVIPVPGAALLMLTGLAGAGVMRRRRQAAA